MLVKNKEQYTQIDFSDFDPKKEWKLLPQLLKLSKEEWKDIAKKTFEEFYEGQTLQKWMAKRIQLR